jgi:photosystem II stability/assembly factor-like uncharacterized protein
MHPENPDILLAGTGHDYYSHEDLVRTFPEPREDVTVEKGGAFLTTDGGDTWERTLDAEIISAVEICESNPDIAYAANEFSCYRSEDGGRTWEKLDPETDQDNPYGPKGYIAGFPMDFAVDPDDPDRVFVNNYGGGNFFSDDGGKTWSIASKGYTGAICNGGIDVCEQDPNTIYAAARSGSFKSSNGGEFWQGLGYPPARSQECSAITMSPENPDLVMAGFCDIVARSTDGGNTWDLVELPMRGEAQPLTIEFAPSAPQTAYLGMGHIGFVFLREDEPPPANGIFKSTDAGKTWEAIGTDELEEANVCWIEADPENPDIVYAATLVRGLYKSENGGEAWERILDNDSRIFSVCIHPSNPKELFVSSRGGVFHSRNGGENWDRYANGLDPEARISSVLLDPRNPDRLWASSLSAGVYYMDLSGDRRWTPVNRGLYIRAVEHLDITSDGKRLYAATYGGGIFRLDTYAKRASQNGR